MIRAPLRAGETAKRAPGSLRQRPRAGADRHSGREAATRAAHGRHPRAAPARPPTTHRACPALLPRSGIRAARQRRPAPGHRASAAAQARRCACHPRSASRARGGRVAARPCLRASQKSRSALPPASRRRAARSRAPRNRSAPRAPQQRVRRHARQRAGEGCPAGRSRILYFYTVSARAQEGYPPAQRLTVFRIRPSAKPSCASTGARSKISL